MKTRKSNKTFKMIAATGVAIFSLTAVFSATIAWYAANKDVKGDGLNIKVNDVDRLFSKMTLHKYLGKDSSGNLLFNQTAGGTFTFNGSTTAYNGSNDAKQMGDYSLDKPRHPLLAIIELNQTVDTSKTHFSISATTKQPFLGEFVNGQPVLELKETGNPLSSIIRFFTDHFEDIDDIPSGSVSLGDLTIDAYSFANPADANWDAFVEFTKSGEQLVYSDWYNDKVIIDSSTFAATEKKVTYVSMVFDYYDDAINFVYNMYLGDEILSAEYVNFACDWTLVI